MWIKQSEDTKLPKWLTDNLRSKCECGSDIENHYNSNNEITGRHCSNPKCPYVLAQCVEDMCAILQVKGIGNKTGFKWITEHKMSSHFETVPYIFKEKPTISIYDLLRISFIKGVDGRWSTVANQCDTVDDLFTKYKGQYCDLLHANKDKILFGAQYFNIHEKIKMEYEPLIVGTVMISGNIRGLNNRNSLIQGINQMSKGLVELTVSESKRKTGIMALIQEADTPNRGKAECALENGIPIMTPAEFKTHIVGLMKKKMGERKKRS